jgi:hypothetical protein
VRLVARPGLAVHVLELVLKCVVEDDVALLVRIPTAPGHLFRPDPATDSDGTRPPIPVTRPSIPTAPGHPFR